MSLRLPHSLGENRQGGSLSSIEAAVVAEKASALGVAGRRVEKALAALGDPRAVRSRDDLVEEAAELVWAFLIQRELCSLRDREQVIADFGIPAEVMARVGAARRPGLA